MNEIGVFTDHGYMDDKDQEIKFLEESYASAQKSFEKTLAIKDAELEVLRGSNDNANSLIGALRDELSGTFHRLGEIENHWLYKLHKGITNLHKLRLHIKE